MKSKNSQESNEPNKTIFDIKRIWGVKNISNLLTYYS